jgi:uncharacterized protein YycO
MAEVVRYGAGDGASGTIPGDFILTHRYHNWYSDLISFGQGIRFQGKRRPYAHWSHAAFITGYDGEIIEARGRGIIRQNIHEYKDREYHYVHLNYEMSDRLQAIAFAESCLGDGYGFLTIIALALTIMTPAGIEFGLNGTEICSALVASCLERGPYIFPKGAISMMPADLAEYFDICP